MMIANTLECIGIAATICGEQILRLFAVVFDAWVVGQSAAGHTNLLSRRLRVRPRLCAASTREAD
jgi:hypothetical protein